MEGKFGKVIRNEAFMLQKDAALTNHGSYGTVPKCVFEYQQKLLLETEDHPDAWFRFKNIRYWRSSLETAAEFVGAKVENLTFVQNATTGMNAVVRSVDFKKGDVLLIHNWTYNAVKNACKYVCDGAGAELKMLDLDTPVITKEDIIRKYKEYLDETPNVRLAVIDHITSGSAVIFPVKELTSLLQSKGILVAIDGAHAPGQVLYSSTNVIAQIVE